jgi:hypothetical protein
LQLVLAAVPWIKYGNWAIFLMTVIGTILAVMTGSLRVWRKEKYATRKIPRSSGLGYVITRGNGHKHVIAILPDDAKSGLFLDDLAGAVSHADNWSRATSVFFAVLWIFFLIVAAGLKDHAWFLLGVGAIGMVQNLTVASAPRDPAAHGIPLSEIETVFGKRLPTMKDRPKVMSVLYQVEDAYPGLGFAIRPEFFPDFALRPDEVTTWEKKAEVLKKIKEEEKRKREEKKRQEEEQKRREEEEEKNRKNATLQTSS